MRGATTVRTVLFDGDMVSIHAPHAGRDRLAPDSRILLLRVSIHAPHAGRDPCRYRISAKRISFNPRAPCGARPPPPASAAGSRRFNPRAPCGARLLLPSYRRRRMGFNPRAPCGARHVGNTTLSWTVLFQSTRPMRGATLRIVGEHPRKQVSIHAPHTGRDEIHAPRITPLEVSIHAPHAGRDARCDGLPIVWPVSIHAPHAGRDIMPPPPSSYPSRFNPRAPCGARLTQSGS